MVTQELPEALNADAGDGAVLGGRYRLMEVLGRGAMASVYRAYDESLGRDVAVKVFAAGSTDEEVLLRQETETKVLAEFNHPGLVTLYDGGTDHRDQAAPRRFLVMELVEGPDLRQRLGQGPMPEEEVASLGAALAHVHGHGVIHRDIKPANVLLPSKDDTESAAKLADFGIARIVDGDRLTATGATVGTACYLSPEQAMGSALTPASDIYSLGLVLLECLKGITEYPGTPVESAVARLQRAPVLPTEIDSRFAELLGAMTDIRPESRPSADDVAELLGLVAESGPTRAAARTRVLPAIPDHPPAIAVTGQPPASRTRDRVSLRSKVNRRTPRRRAGLVAMAAAALLAVLLIASALYAGSTQRTTVPATVETGVPPSSVSPAPTPAQSEQAGESTPQAPASEETPASEPLPAQVPVPADSVGTGQGKAGSQNEPKNSKGRGKD